MSEIRTLFTGLVLGESPRWHAGHLYCFDMVTHEVVRIDLAANAEVVARESSAIASLEFLDEALLVARRDGSIARRQADGSFAAMANLAGLATTPWNDMVVDGRGNTYIGNVGFEFPGGEFRPGVIAQLGRDGHARVVADGLAFPNGVAVTPDDSTLIVAESYGHCLTAFDIAPDGGLSNRRVWADLPGAFPDGICLDAEGAVWYADVPGKRCVRVAEGGRVLETIELDRGCFACMLGGPDSATLFMVAAQYPPASYGPDAPRTGQVLTTQAPVAHAGRP